MHLTESAIMHTLCAAVGWTLQGCGMREFQIAVFPGDGIGHEVIPPCVALLEAVTERVGGFALDFTFFEAGAELYRRTGEALPAAALLGAEAADAILLGAMGLPDVRYPDGTEVAPHLDFRDRFELRRRPDPGATKLKCRFNIHAAFDCVYP